MSQTIKIGGTVAAPAFSAAQTYAYDALNRLGVAQEGANWKQTFGYDQWGNRWIDDTQTSNIPIQSGTPLGTAAGGTTAYLANNQLSGRTYDAAGNGSPMSGRTYQYDVENRIVSATGGTPATTESFEYDGEGRRVKRTVNGVATVFVYDAFGQLAQEYGTAGVAGRNYVFADHLGSTRMLVDGTGTVKGWWDFAPYGEEVPGSVGARSGVNGFAYAGQSPSMMFTGQVRDRLADGSVSGLDYFGARHLGAAHGRFTSPDPLFFRAEMLTDPQRFNPYSYVRNNPLRYVDPKGEEIELTGDTEEERRSQLTAIQSAVGKAGSMLTIVQNKDSGKYLVGVVGGDIAGFAKMNSAAAGFAQIIQNSEVAQFSFAAGHEQLAFTDSKGKPLTLSENHAVGAAGRDSSGQLHVYVLRPSECCSGVEASKFSGIWFGGLRDLLGRGVGADIGTEAGHEFGHAGYLMQVGRNGRNDTARSNRSALDLENAVRKARDPNAPVRTTH